MKKQTTQKTEYIIEQDEINTIKTCLDYCYHRLTNHSCGISDYVNINKLDKIRKTLNEKDNETKNKINFKKMNEDIDENIDSINAMIDSQCGKLFLKQTGCN